jgi:penicillin-binding protein 1C
VGNFSGRPMQGVGGITGAGPLLHRAALLVARRYPPGELPTPAQLGAVPVRVCRLSGLRAGPACPPMTEWFIPGTEPGQGCDWHRRGGVVLPTEYLDWAGSDARDDPAHSPGTKPVVSARSRGQLRIVSPQEGDRYSIPAGVDPRYATIALRVTGGGGKPVRWYVDGREWPDARWPLARGEHLIRAVTADGRVDAVRISVR